MGKTIFGINSSLILDMPLMLVVMALLTIPALTTKKLHRWQGILLLCFMRLSARFSSGCKRK